MTSEQIKKKLDLDRIGDFSENRARVLKNNKYGHVDLNGKVVVPIIYDYASSFQEGRTWVEKNGKEGHVDKNGKVTTPIIYDYVGNFKEGRAWVEIRNFEFYINLNGIPVKHKDYYKLIKGIFK